MPEKIQTKAKVLFLMHLPPPIHGASIAGGFIKDSVLINTAFDTTYVNLATNKTINQSGKGSLKKLAVFFSLFSKVFKTLRKNKFDICHLSLTASGLGFYKDCIIIAMLKRKKIKIVYHCHNKGVADASTSAIARSFYRFAFKNTKTILINSYLYPDVSLYVKPEDVFYCPYGIHIIPEAANKKISDGTEKAKILFLSNMIVEKGVYVLLDALKILKSKGIDFVCDYVGAWSALTPDVFLRDIEANNLQDVVRVHGPKYKADKETFFNNADIFVFPTFYHYETFGLVNLEAMQYSLPIISTPEGGIPGVIVNGETGFLVTQKNSEELAGKIEQLIRDPNLRMQMGKAGKKRFETHFTFDIFERRLFDILQQVSVS